MVPGLRPRTTGQPAQKQRLYKPMIANHFPRGPYFTLSVLFCSQMFAVGTIAYGFGLLSKPIASEFDLPRADMNLGLMILILGMAVFSPLIGRALDRLPGRLILPGGALLFGGGCLVIAVAESLLVMILAAFFLVALGGAALGPLTSSTLTARIFDKNRGRALGIVSISSSVGGMLLLPAMALIVEGYGWRVALGAIGLLTLLLIGGFGWLVKATPPARKVASDSASDSTLIASPTVPAPADQWTIASCLRSVKFWAITLSVGLVMAVDQALLISLIPYGTDRGFSLQSATLIVSLISGMAIIGKLAVGMLADRVDPRWLFLAIIILTAAFFFLLTLDPAYPVLLGAAAALGLGFGGTMPLWATFIAHHFGTASFGTVMGLMVPLQMPLTLTAISYVGHSYDTSGSYHAAFLICTAVLLVALLTVLPLRREEPA